MKHNFKIENTELDGVKIITPTVYPDSRGYFLETWTNDVLPNVNFIQDNEAISAKNVARGLHYQNKPFEQSKLIRVVSGAIIDIIVDIRKHSKTFGKYFFVVLNDINKKQLFVPHGYAHGYITLADNTIVNYKVDAPYSKEHEDGLNIMLYAEKIAEEYSIISPKLLILSDKDKLLK